MKTTHTVTGLDEMKARMESLAKKDAKKAARKMATAAAKIVNKDAKRRCKSKRVRRAIGQRVRSYRGSGNSAAIVGVRAGFRSVSADGSEYDPAKVGPLIEYGRAQVETKEKKVLVDTHTFDDFDVVYGVKVRAVPPDPFMRPAADENQDKIRDAMASAAIEVIDRADSAGEDSGAASDSAGGADDSG